MVPGFPPGPWQWRECSGSPNTSLPQYLDWRAQDRSRKFNSSYSSSKLLKIIFFCDKLRNLSKIVSVLLSASVERFFVSRMQDFLNPSLREAFQKKSVSVWFFSKGGGVMSETKLFEDLLCLDIFQEEVGRLALFQTF